VAPRSSSGWRCCRARPDGHAASHGIRIPGLVGQSVRAVTDRGASRGRRSIQILIPRRPCDRAALRDPYDWCLSRIGAGTHIGGMADGRSHDTNEDQGRWTTRRAAGISTLSPIPPTTPADARCRAAKPNRWRPSLPTGRVAVIVWTYTAAATIALTATSLLVGVSPQIATPFSVAGISSTTTGVTFWILLALIGSAWSRKEDGRAAMTLGMMPVIGAMALGGPTAAAWVALVGTLELRELRGGIPWYGVLSNHAMQVVPAVLGGLVYPAVCGDRSNVPATALATAAGAATFGACSAGMALALVGARTGRRWTECLGMPWTSLGNWMVAQSAIAWLVSLAYPVVWWSPLALVAANASEAASLAASQSSWLLRHHQLTDLPNGRSLNERAADLRRAGRTGLCVFYIDLDGFKNVNDRHGHSVGDDVLKEVGVRLAASMRSHDFLAHLHGDEFVLLAEGISSDAEATQLIERLQNSLAQTIEHATGRIAIGASVGYQFVTGMDGLDQALRQADHNMTAAKTSRALASGRTRRQTPPVAPVLPD
jgi:diguanylate cyclase (GGDEF)-like protein